jgi:cytochrome c oxidase subunit II
MFSGASTFVSGVDTAFVLIIGISMIFLIGITATIIVFLVRYNKKRNPIATDIEGSTKLEIVWTIIPTFLVLIMFFYGWNGYTPLSKMPKNGLTVKVVSRMWMWKFEYPNGQVTDTLYVPAGKAVLLDMVAMDVIHSLYIPAFRIKQDIVPGKQNKMWFISDKPGRYDLFCTEYCGLRHSYMLTAVQVMPDALFNSWYSKAPAKLDATAAAKPGAIGKTIYENKGCVACHTTDGSKLVGPSFKGIYGHKVTVTTAGKEREITVDDEYISRSINDPATDIVQGYKEGQMVSYKGQLTDDDIKQVIEFIKTLSDK